MQKKLIIGAGVDSWDAVAGSGGNNVNDTVAPYHGGGAAAGVTYSGAENQVFTSPGSPGWVTIYALDK